MKGNHGLGERGAVMPLVAMLFVGLMGFSGLAIDVGYLEYQEQVQQAATDAAATGAAQEAYTDDCDNPSDAAQAAVNDAALNGYASLYVSATSPPSSGPYAGNDCAVAVTISQTKPTFFTKILGFNGMKESTQAVGVAAQSTPGPGCIWLLSTIEGQSNLSNSNVQVAHCDIYINESANMSNATINAAYIGYANGTNNTSGTHFTKATPAPMLLVSDPCPTFSGCEYLTKNEPSTCTTAWNSSGNANIPSGGCYGNFTMSGTGNTVCGLIWVTGLQLQLQNSTISSCAAGVTFAMTSSVNNVNFGKANLYLSAPTSGNSAEMLFWRDSLQSSAVNYSNCTCDLTGMLYYPTTEVNYNSASGDYALIVFGEANFSTSTLSIDTPPPDYGGLSKATLGL